MTGAECLRAFGKRKEEKFCPQNLRRTKMNVIVRGERNDFGEFKRT